MSLTTAELEHKVAAAVVVAAVAAVEAVAAAAAAAAAATAAMAPAGATLASRSLPCRSSIKS